MKREREKKKKRDKNKKKKKGEENKKWRVGRLGKSVGKKKKVGGWKLVGDEEKN